MCSQLSKAIIAHLETITSSVSPELLHGFARGLAPIAFLRNITLLSINMKVIWRASLLKNCEQADQCNNSGETEEVDFSVNCEKCHEKSDYRSNAW